MVQFNLLPDVKLDYIKAVRKRRYLSSLSFIVAGGFLVIFILMFLYVRVNQVGHMHDLDRDITSNVNKIRENKDLDKILTIQNQLNSLPGLHDQKVISSRLIDYMARLTPANVKIRDTSVDFDAKKLIVKGSADTLATVNKFVDTFKYTDYSLVGKEDQVNKAFSLVILRNFNIAQSGSTVDQLPVGFEIEMTYEEPIFKNTAKDGNPIANDIVLNIPNTISNQSELQKPSQITVSGGQQ